MTGVLGQHGGTAGHEGVDQRHGWRRTLPRPNTRAPTRLLPRGRVANDTTPTRLIIYIVDSVGWDEATVLGPKRNQKTNGRFPEIFQTARAVTDCLSLPRFASVDRQVHNHRYHLTRTRIPPLLSDVPPFENPACAPYNSTRELLLSTGSSSLAGAVALSLYPNNSEISNRGDTLGYARTRPLGPHSPIARARERRPATREVPRASEPVGISSRAAPPPRPWKPSERFFRRHPRPRPSGRSPPPSSANRRRPLLIRA